MPCVLRRSGTNFRVYGSLRTASLQICCVLRWLGTYDNEHYFVTHLLCLKMFWDLSYPAWNIFIRHICLYSWAQVRVKFYGQNAGQVSPQSTFYSDTYFCMRRAHTWHLNERFLMTYSPLILDLPVCPSFTPQPTFLMTYSPLIFLSVRCLAQQLKINRKYTTIKRWLKTQLSQVRLLYLSKVINKE